MVFLKSMRVLSILITYVRTRIIFMLNIKSKLIIITIFDDVIVLKTFCTIFTKYLFIWIAQKPYSEL